MRLMQRSGLALTAAIYSFATSAFTSVRAMTSQSNKQGALIFLHGLGDTPAGWSILQFQLPKLIPRLANIEYVFPPAPTIPISINGGVKMPGWFDLYDWPIEVGATDDPKNKMEGVDKIMDAIDELVAQGIDKRKIVVGGFSQGGAIALLAAYHPYSRHQGLAGCAALSAWLTLTKDLEITETQKNTPLFWGHGQYDDKVLFEHQEFGINKLKEKGASQIHSKQYAMSHESDPDEIRDLANFLDSVIFENQSDGFSEKEDL